MSNPPYIGYNPNTGINTLPGTTIALNGQPSLDLIAKIRAGMAAAATKNAVESPPLLPPININTGPGNAVRANSTAYPIGYMFTNAAGTHQFVVRLAGTSAASEPATVTTPLVTTTPFNMGDITDGSATITWMGPVRVTTANPLAPSVYSGAKPAQLTTVNTFGPNGSSLAAAYTSIFQFTGGTGAIQGNANNFLTYALGNQVQAGQGSNQIDASQSTGFGPQSNAITFMTDASLIALDLTTGAQASGLANTTGVYVEVDGVRLSDGMLMASASLAAGVGFIMLDWRANGGRKARKIRISQYSTVQQPNYGRFYTQPEDSVWYPYNPNRYRIAMVGDSLGSGSNSSNYIASYDRATLFAALIGCDDISNLGAGGTGYIASSSPQISYPQRFNDVIKLAPDVLYICNNYNDSPYTSAQRQAAVLSYLQTARAQFPNMMIIAGGTIGGTAPTTNAILEADIKAAVATFADANCFWLPEDSDNPSWETGTGSLTSPNGTGNNDIYKGPTDTTHPSLQGIQYIAQRDANAFRNLITTLSKSP